MKTTDIITIFDNQYKFSTFFFDGTGKRGYTGSCGSYSFYIIYNEIQYDGEKEMTNKQVVAICDVVCKVFKNAGLIGRISISNKDANQKTIEAAIKEIIVKQLNDNKKVETWALGIN